MLRELTGQEPGTAVGSGAGRKRNYDADGFGGIGRFIDRRQGWQRHRSDYSTQKNLAPQPRYLRLAFLFHAGLHALARMDSRELSQGYAQTCTPAIDRKSTRLNSSH